MAENNELEKTLWTAAVGSAGRLQQAAADLVHHFEQRLAAADGKGMIVCMSRWICVELQAQISNCGRTGTPPLTARV